MALVIMGHGFSPAALEWQTGLGAIQRLHLALLVATQDHRTLGRVHVQLNDVGEFLLKPDVKWRL
jgi:hypothetical protein